jgi:DNA polymerase elongation subunit (family B)
MSKNNVNLETIGEFLEGRDPQKYIVAIEAPYHKNEVYLIINDPENGKSIETHKYKPFIWFKHEVSELLYNGNRRALKSAIKKFGIKISGLKIDDEDGNTPDRLYNGYKYIATCDTAYTSLLNFFKEGGLEVYEQETKHLFMALSPHEQFFIQTGKRLFKGMDDYDDLHRFQFDLETTGLDPNKDSIFQIGIRDNRGEEHVMEVDGDTPQEKRDNESLAIINFFKVIDVLKPDLITAYNSESFDWDFFFKRCDRLSIDITKIAKTLSSNKIRRRDATLKLGQDTEHYQQTLMWGYNILDIAHAVRRAQAINSEIKKWNLKYITKFSNVAKKNRIYVDGDKIYTTWHDREGVYYLNDVNGDWFKHYDENPNPLVDDENYKETTGAYIVQRYLLDDLWETDQVDMIFNQASFLLAKIIPTSYMRSSTMGTAGTWRLLMSAWSYENGLAIPDTESKRDFTGGLSRLLEVGYAENVIKLDYAALYPNIQLTWDIIPDLDISGVMKGMLLYIAETRDKYKGLKNEYDERGDKTMADLYDKKQLPLKILANSFFGSFGAPYIFNWGDIDSAEETTCRGRQYLRLMVKHFHEKYNFRPLVGDTDGFNFAIPDNVDSIKYIPNGNHRMTEADKGVELSGVSAIVAEFNEIHMIGRMGLDIDDVCKSTINFARKNYANHIIKNNEDGTTKLKLKLVGNSIKSKKMPTYIEKFIDTNIELLLGGKGFEFIQAYYDTVEDIYNYRIPLTEIASKSRVKMSIDAYKKYILKRNKAGNLMARQAHMELAMKHNLNVNLGDTIHYVNIGSVKSHGDLKTITDKETGKKEVQLNCKLISSEQLEVNPELTTDEYNVARYLEAFNKRIKPLLVCFHPDIRDKETVNNKGVVKKVPNILISMVKDKETKTMVLEPRKEFTEKQCELTSGFPYEEKDQDDYLEDLMTMEDKEIKFWVSVKKTPNEMGEDEWLDIKNDYLDRLIMEMENGIKSEKYKLDDVFKRLEVSEMKEMKETGIIPVSILSIAELKEIDGKHVLESRKWNATLCDLNDIFKYESEAEERDVFYLTLDGVKDEDRYDLWVAHLNEKEFLSGSGITSNTPHVMEIVVEKIVEPEEVVEVIEPKEDEEDEWNF